LMIRAQTTPNQPSFAQTITPYYYYNDSARQH
jgi:hypothetical protein